MTRFATFLADESGATVIEYAFIASLVSVVIVSAVRTLGLNVNSLYMSVVAAFPSR